MSATKSPLKEFAGDFLTSVSFLTVFPVSSMPSDPRALARSMRFFPVTGFLLGMFCFWIYAFVQNFLPPSAALLVLVFLPVVFSGGLHADGFADFCDGFFGGKDREDVLRIMKDSRIGAFGGLGLLFIVLMKFELIKQVPHLIFFFPFALAAGRMSQVILSYFLPYAGREGGLGGSTALQVRPFELALAGLFVAGFALLGGPAALLGVVTLLPVLALLAFFFKRRIGGVTGDLLGASSEISEIWILAAGAAAGMS